MLLYNAVVVTLGADPQVIDRGAVLVREGVVNDFGPSAALEAAHAAEPEKLDLDGRLLMPGFICTHTHFYGMYSRGMDLHDAPPMNFLEILQRLWWRLDRALDEEGVRHSVNVCLCAAIRAGTTTLFDHHASPACVPGSLDIVHDCVKAAGLRASLCYEVTDRNGPEEAEAGIAENIRFLRRVREEKDPMIHAMFGLHAALTLSDETLAEAKRRVDGVGADVGFHIHVAEGPDDPTNSMKRHGVPLIQRLEKFGITGPNSIFAHCVALDDAEKDLLASTRTIIVHNPSSNMNNAIGCLDVPAMVRRGALIGLGTDGMTSDMIQEHKTAYVIHKHFQRNPQSCSVETADMLLKNNARIASQMFGRRIGAIEKGAAADLVVLDYISPTPLAAGALPWHLMFGMNSNLVRDVMCAGRFVMRDRAILTLDERRVMDEARAHAPAVWARIPGLVAADRARAE